MERQAIFRVSSQLSLVSESVNLHFPPLEPNIMTSEAEISDSYHLKWSLYPSYMHSCISTALNNDSFTDVTLVTTDGHQIMAHRFVLSYSSSYLAQILQMQKKETAQLPLIIVLPQEIDHTCLKVLVQYMYSGEAKVSKDILNSVLRGADILKIKGLYREKANSDKPTRITQKSMQSSTAPPTAAISKPSTTDSSKLPASSKETEAPSKPKRKIIYTKIITKKPRGKTLIRIPVNAEKGRQILKTVRLKPTSIPKVLASNSSLEPIFNKVKDRPSKEVRDRSVAELKTYKSTIKKTASVKSEPKDTNNLQFLVINDEQIDWREGDMITSAS
nr:unnamed protein product [Callosobruchus chinensis]